MRWGKGEKRGGGNVESGEVGWGGEMRVVRGGEEVGCEVEWWGGVGRGGDEVGEWVGESGWVGGRGRKHNTSHITP